MNAIDHLDNKAKSLLPMIESMPQIPEVLIKGSKAMLCPVKTTTEELKSK